MYCAPSTCTVLFLNKTWKKTKNKKDREWIRGSQGLRLGGGMRREVNVIIAEPHEGSV